MSERRLSLTVAASAVTLTALLAACAVSVPAHAATVAGLPGTASATATATSTPSGTASSSDTIALTVVLDPSDRAGLRGLVADASDMTTVERTTSLAAVAPTASARDRVTAELRDAGFTVQDAGLWQLGVTGTVEQASRFFGVDLVGSDGALHPTAAPTIPSTIAADVTTVLGLDQRPVLQANALPGGKTPADLASAYAATRSGSDGAGSTIATVQFSGWNADDLAQYASRAGLSVPSVTNVSVSGASTTTPDGDGDVEVALDQEMLLATAPKAAQRVYVADNSAQGMYDVWNQVANEVKSSGIRAVSTSWGSCQSQMPASLQTAVQDAIARAVVSGATVFAASGDYGAYDCAPSANPGATTAADVSFPAVLPSVVGVGGTSLTGSSSAWSETTWSDSANRRASGGGVSKTTARPSWQSGIGVAGSTRAVPDISATADPKQGVAFYSSNKAVNGFALGGGTSAAAPIMAGQFAATLSSLGCTTGVGDIHATLYNTTSAFRDVTSGNNLLYSAGKGYDLATGLGSPNWAALASALPGSAGCGAAAAAATPGPSLTMTAGQSKDSPSGQYRLTMQADGNLVVYGNGRALWASNTSGTGASSFVVQPDGNAVIYRPNGVAVWSSGTSRVKAPVTLELTDLGDLRMTKDGSVVWRTNSPGADTLTPAVNLVAGQSIQDSSNRRRLVMQADGNLVLYIDGAARWSTGTSGKRGAYLAVQSDGNAVVYTKDGVALWSSRSSRSGANRFVMQADGNLVLYRGATAIWASGTH